MGRLRQLATRKKRPTDVKTVLAGIIFLCGSIVSKLFDVEPLIVIHCTALFMDALRAAELQ